jgi:hypothetical protein
MNWYKTLDKNVTKYMVYFILFYGLLNHGASKLRLRGVEL